VQSLVVTEEAVLEDEKGVIGRCGVFLRRERESKKKSNFKNSKLI